MAATNTLTDTAIRKAAPGNKPRKLTDGGGLYIEIQPNGARWWRLKYRIHGKEKRLSLGVYPETTLAQARKKRDDARAQIAQGVDPSDTRKESKTLRQREQQIAELVAAGAPLPGTFAAVAQEWLEHVHVPKVVEGTAKRTRAQLDRDVLPWIGQKPARDVTPPMVLELLRKVEARGAIDTASRVKDVIGMVMRYAVSRGLAERDPTPDLRGALTTPMKEHRAAIVDPDRLGELLRAFEAYESPATRAALQLAALTFQRPGNVRAMQWGHLDLESCTWTIPSFEMKRSKQDKATGMPHIVPLARQAVRILHELRPLTGLGVHCFPGLRDRSRPISDVTLNAAMRRLGFESEEVSAHGFRATARTLIVEQIPGVDPEWIEAQLAHGKSGPLGRAYDRAQYMAQRRKMMQDWADYLDRLRGDAPGVSAVGTRVP